MKFKKIIPIVFAFALFLGACNGPAPASSEVPQGSSEAPSSQPSEPGPSEKLTPTVAISMDEGKEYNVGTFVTPSYSVVPSSLQAAVNFKKGGQDVQAVNPNEIGDYLITVSVNETDQYRAASLSKHFYIRQVPTLSFTLDGNPLEDGHEFALGDPINISVNSSVSEARVLTKIQNSSGQTISGQPESAGIYYFVAEVLRTETIGSAYETISFEVVDASKVTPTIKFYYNGEEKCLESNWLDGGFATSHYDADQFDIDQLTASVSDDAPYDIQYAFKELDAPESVDGSPIAKPSNPLAPGIYTLTITVNESAHYNAASRWAGFVINEGGDVPPVTDTIKFYYNGEEKCLESNWLDGGFATSHYDADQFDITKLSYTAPAGSSHFFTLKALDAPEEAEGVQIPDPTSNPLAPGIYTITVTPPTGSAKWAGFVINDNGGVTPPPVTDTIKFYYDGVEKCLESNWLDEGFVASHYDASDFDITKLTFTAPAGSTHFYTLKALDAPEEAEGVLIADPTSNPLAPGIYALTVTDPNGTVKWAGFVINDNGEVPPVVTGITFFYNGEQKCLESNWLDGGFATSHYDASDFDITKLTFTAPEGSTHFFTLKALDAPEEAEGVQIPDPSNPLAPGIYTLTVTTPTGTVKWAGFVINDNGGDIPPVVTGITFYYNGEQKCLESNWLDGGFANSHYDSKDFDITKLTFTAPEGSTHFYTLKALDAPEEAEGVQIADPSNPLAPGIYTLTVTAPNGTVKWAGFVINDSAPTHKDNPTIRFYYDGEEVGISGSRWFYEGYGDSKFPANEFDIDLLSYVVDPAYSSNASWTLDDVAISAPTSNPLAAGVYALTVNVPEGDHNTSASLYILFAIEAVPETVKDNPAINFYYEGEEIGISGSRWFYEGYADSKFPSNTFDVAKLTYTVTPDYPANISWTLDDVIIAAPTNPLEAGVYALTVNVPEGEHNTSTSLYILFAIEEATTKENPVIHFYYDGEEVGISGSRWFYEGYGDSKFPANEFDVSKLTYTVSNDYASTTSWTLDEIACAAPVNPLEAGVYALTVNVPEGTNNTQTSAYILFAITEATSKENPVIHFYYDDEEVGISGSRWFYEGYGDSKFPSNEFDISKLSFTVTNDYASTSSWTLDDVAISAPVNPLEAGVYALTVNVPEGTNNTAATAYILFAITESTAKENPVIRFYYDGEEVGISGSRWFYEGYGDSKFLDTNFDIAKLSYTVTNDYASTASWTLDEVACDAPTSNPLAGGVYAMTINVPEGTNNTQASAYILFAIEASAPVEKVTPDIHFYYDGQEVGIFGSRWFYEGYGDSKIAASDFDIAKLTFTVTNDYASSTVWTVDDAPIAAPTSNPLATGVYALRVNVPEGDNNVSASQYILFAII